MIPAWINNRGEVILEWDNSKHTPPFGRLYDADGSRISGHIFHVNLTTGEVRRYKQHDNGLMPVDENLEFIVETKQYKAPLKYIPVHRDRYEQ